MEPRKYKFNNSTLTIIFGDIMSSEAEVIVSSDDTGITMGGGVSKSILVKGGPIIKMDARKKLPAQIGDVVVSTSGSLECQKFIFHCLTIDYAHRDEIRTGKVSNSDDINNYILQHSVNKCFRLLQALDINSIAFPCIGAGSAHIPLGKVAEVMAEAISSNLCMTQKPYEVELYLYDRKHEMREMDYIDIFENFASRSALAKYKSQVRSNHSLSGLGNGRKVVNIPKREDMKHNVFISYSREDSDTVDELRLHLENNKVEYWIDREGIYSGEDYKEVIVDAIDIAKVVIFVSSAKSNSSPYVIKELGYAEQKKKKIIPLLIDDAPYAKSMSLDLVNIDRIELDGTELPWKKLILSVQAEISK